LIYWLVRIFTCPPRFLERGQDKCCSTFQKCYLSRPFFCLSAISIIRGCRKTRTHMFRKKIEHVSIVLQILLGTLIRVYG